MIRCFRDSGTEGIFKRLESKEARRVLPVNLHRIAKRKLEMIHFAVTINDLRNPPGNHLEKLVGNLRDWWSIRINDQWRVVFKWANDAAEGVYIVDYHG